MAAAAWLDGHANQLNESVAVRPRNAYLRRNSETGSLYGDRKRDYPVSTGCGGMEGRAIERIAVKRGVGTRLSST